MEISKNANFDVISQIQNSHLQQQIPVFEFAYALNFTIFRNSLM